MSLQSFPPEARKHRRARTQGKRKVLGYRLRASHSACIYEEMARYDLIAVYLMASKPNGTLYLGVTSDLLQRGFEHREGRFDGFAKKYGCWTLVWWEQHFDINQAIAREKQIKGWRRKWKLALIEKREPGLA